MSDTRYDVVFSGELHEGFELDEVKANFARLFKQAEDKVEQIFSHSNVTIKSNLEKPAAEKYQQALAKAGARVTLQEKDTDASLSLTIEPTQEEAQEQSAEATAADDAAASFGIANVVAPGREIQPKVKSTNTQDSESQEAQRQTADGGAEGGIADAKDSTESRSLPFKFTGSGGEYFKIWIVNIFLTIITLGIYSAWAKVRNKRYFYSNTQLNGSTFEYLANPLKILQGRIIAVLFFLLYSGAGSVSPILGGILAIVMLVVLPWLVVKSLSFNARNSAYRNITFGFDGDIWGAVKAFIAWPLLGAFTFGLMAPFAYYKQQHYMANGYKYGTEPFNFSATAGAYYKIFLVLFGAVIGMVFLVGMIAGITNNQIPGIQVLIILPVYLYIFSYFTVRTKNLVYNNTLLAQHGFDSRLEVNSFAGLFFTNTLLTVLTVGLFTPWAKVRTAHYMADRLNLEAQGDLNRFIADEQEQLSALGEELGDVFDFDIGL